MLCSAFDPNTFWDKLEKGIGTWYYGSPAMHSGILTEASLRAAAIKRCRLRLVCNAAVPPLEVTLRITEFSERPSCQEAGLTPGTWGISMQTITFF